MTALVRVLTVCVVVSLCSPVAAGASRSHARIKRREFAPVKRHHSRLPLSIALERAFQLWSVEPCGGSYRVELTTLPAEVRGHSGWREPATSLGSYTTPSGSWFYCVIQLPASAWTAEAVASEWPDACSVVLHEWGHLTGHPHSDVPGEPAEPPGMTEEQLEVMRSAPPVDLQRCGWAP
jgi:hypothetical protein